MRNLSVVCRIAVAAFVLVAVGASPAFAYRLWQSSVGRSTSFTGVFCDNPTGFAHWNNSFLNYSLNPANQGAGKEAPIGAALNSWTAVTPASYILSYKGTTNAGWAYDNVNTIMWASGNGCTNMCLAITALTLQSGQVIIDADVSFNNDKPWNTNGAQWDVEAEMAHELGHTLGIGHTEVNSQPYPTMRQGYDNGTTDYTYKRSLENDDRNALNCIYNRYRPNQIMVNYPNGGETFVVGCNATITWTSAVSFSTVKIERSTDGGTSWTTIVSNAPDIGSYVWTVSGPTTTQGRVRVTGGVGPDVDVSDANFTIVNTPPAIISPNGGEVLSAGQSVNITWTAPACFSTVDLAYSTTAGGAPWLSIGSSVPNTGTYVWTVSTTATSRGRVRVSDVSATDASDANFCIQGPTVSYPNGGEVLTAGVVATITWTSCGSVPTVNIDYSTDNGSTWNPIVTNTANDGANDWTVASTATSQGLIRITGGGANDMSDAPFTIALAPTGWVADGIPLKIPTGQVMHAVTASDGGGGAFVVWRVVTPTTGDVYVGRVTGSGTFPSGWVYQGKRIATSGPGFSDRPHHVVPDGSGGIYVAFESNVPGQRQTRVQHVNSDGTIGTWPVGGIVVGIGGGGRPRLLPDGQGGVYVAVRGYEGTSVVRLTSTGAVATGWPALGVQLFHDFGLAGSIDIAPAGTTGVYVAWDGGVQRITSSGAIEAPWPTSTGLSIPLSSQVRTIEDGSGGVYIAYRPGDDPTILKLTRVASNATFPPGWSSDGIFVSYIDNTFDGVYDSHTMAPDGSGGVYLAYVHRPEFMDMCATVQRVLGSGVIAPGWNPEDGALVGPHSTLGKANPFVLSDGMGGAVVTWQEVRNDPVCLSIGCNWDIYSGRVTASGQIDPSFPANGGAVGTGTSVQNWPFLVIAAPNLGIVGWQDSRPTAAYCANCEQSVYANRVAFDAIPPAQTTPGPTVHCESITLSWSAPGDDGNTGTATMYDLRRSTVAFTEANFGAGTPIATAAPAVAGTWQEVDDQVGSCSPSFYYAMKVRDEAGNWSPIGVVNYGHFLRTPCVNYPICIDENHKAPLAPAVLQLSSPSPNPFVDGGNIPYGVPNELAGSQLDIGLYDVAGRKVATFFHGAAVAGFHKVEWTSSTFGGKRPSAGVYYVRLTSPERTLHRAVVVLDR